MVSIPYFFQGNSMAKNFRRFDESLTDFFNEMRDVTFDTRLITSNRNSFVHGISQRNEIRRWAIHADDRNSTALFNRINRPLKGDGRSRLNKSFYSQDTLSFTTGSFTSHAVDAAVGPKKIRQFFDEDNGSSISRKL